MVGKHLNQEAMIPRPVQTPLLRDAAEAASTEQLEQCSGHLIGLS